MSLPIWQQIHIRTSSLEDLNFVLSQNLNLKHPAVIVISTLNSDQQREIIGLVENHYFSNNISFKFPYPVYILTDHESSITTMPTVRDLKFLPQFFAQKESKMNVKEAHLVSKNKLLQQEITNSDTQANEIEFAEYGQFHRQIYRLEDERQYYRTLLTRMTKGAPHG